MINNKDSLEVILNNSFKETVPLAFLKFLNSFIKIYDNESLTFIDDINIDLYEMSNFAINLLVNLEDILDENTEEKLHKVETIINYKMKLEEMYRVLSSYNTELYIASHIINDKYNELSLDDKDVDSLDYDLFFEECFLFISDYIDKNDFENVIHQLLRNIPIRITRNKYYEYIEKSISQIKIDESDESLKALFDLLKEQFIGNNTKGYDDFLPDISTNIENSKNKALQKLSIDEIKSLWKEIESVNDNLLNIGNLLFSLYDIFNYTAVLLMQKNVSLESLFNSHVAYKDFYLSISSIFSEEIESQEKELLIETLPDLIDKHIEILQNKLVKINNEIIKIYEEEDANFDNNEIIVNRLENYQIVLACLNSNLDYVISYYNRTKNDLAATDNIKSQIRKLVNYIDNELKTMNNQLRKARMQNFLGVIPLAMDKGEFMNYLINAVEMTSSDKNKALILDNIGKIMDYYGFFDKACSCNHDHKDH